MIRIFADLDGTLTDSRTQISSEMKDIIERLGVVVISGQDRQSMVWQLDGANVLIMSQSGNDSPWWENKLNNTQRKKIRDHIAQLLPYCQTDNLGDLIDDRGCQVTLSMIGHHADKFEKDKYDPTKKKRIKLLEKFPLRSKTVMVKAAGTTSIDYTIASKGDNLKKYLDMFSIDKNDCLYLGDALMPGGNDHSVVGIMPVQQVQGPDESLSILKAILQFKHDRH